MSERKMGGGGPGCEISAALPGGRIYFFWTMDTDPMRYETPPPYDPPTECPPTPKAPRQFLLVHLDFKPLVFVGDEDEPIN